MSTQARRFANRGGGTPLVHFELLVVAAGAGFVSLSITNTGSLVEDCDIACEFNSEKLLGVKIAANLVFKCAIAYID